MPKLRDVSRNLRSKNAGPFWVTVDIFFKTAEGFEKYHQAAALGPATIAAKFGVDAEHVKYYPVKDLSVLKISYPREAPQGGKVERDMHQGQQYVRLLDIELD